MSMRVAIKGRIISTTQLITQPGLFMHGFKQGKTLLILIFVIY
jgi:hypothetical protein